jgi:thiamine-phosphate pyrophosphorylase
MRGLYAIVDTDRLAHERLDPLAFALEILRARPAALQLRAKHLGARATLQLLGALLGPCRAAGVPLFCNDRIDLALIAGVDGVHVGQHDPNAREVRRISSELLIGISTHDFSQLEAALGERPTYVAFGPVFSTSSKAQPDPVVGLEGLREAGARCRRAGVPLVAIGGLTLSRAREIAEHADAGAVISALDTDATAIAETARALHAALGGSR